MIDIKKCVKHLQTKNKILFLLTSNRWEKSKDEPKSNILARDIADKLNGKQVTIIDVTKLHIYDCEGNVSERNGNSCGVKEAVLKDTAKNPSKCHRCWASINHNDDELWKITKILFDSDAVVLFGSVRWGQTNAVYQKLIERLTWLENRHATLKESNIVKDIDIGCIFVGQNWRGQEVVDIQKEVLKFYGFNVVADLCGSWQYTNNKRDESKESYKKAFPEFVKRFDIIKVFMESFRNFISKV